MTTNTRIFFAIFAYISALVGAALAVINDVQEPQRTTVAAVAGCCGIAFLILGIKLSRRPRL